MRQQLQAPGTAICRIRRRPRRPQRLQRQLDEAARVLMCQDEGGQCAVEEILEVAGVRCCGYASAKFSFCVPQCCNGGDNAQPPPLASRTFTSSVASVGISSRRWTSRGPFVEARIL